MRIHFFPPYESVPYPMIVSIGVFDGVHLGHQKIIRELIKKGKNKNLHKAILTFPYPPSWYMKEKEPVSLLMSPTDKIKFLHKLGIDAVYYLDFYQVREMKPIEFIKNYLLPYSVKYIIVGENFRFGKDKEGDANLLKTFCKEKGTEVEIMAGFTVNREVISSTKIRDAIKEGDIKKAEKFLGRPYSVTGKVIPGKGVGKHIGFPTINLKLKHYALPPCGVYAGKVRVKNNIFPSAIDLRKLRKYWLVEAHLLRFKGELYRKKVEISFIEFIRRREKVKDTSVLRALIRDDVKKVRSLIGK